MLIDTHTHLYWESFKPDFDEMIHRAANAGVYTIINVGVDIETSQKALDQLKNTKWPKGLSVYSTIGIHPHEALKYYDRDSYGQNNLTKDLKKLEEIYQSNPEKVVGIGECGLDYFFENNPGFIPPSISLNEVKDLQKQLFQSQIDLAKKLNLPAVVHCREAWDETLEMIEGQVAILHCYSGLSSTTLRLAEARSGQANLLVSFAANITYPKNEYLREAAKILPLDRILLETDSPFLAPQGKRGQRNEPSAVLEIAQTIAKIKGISLEEVTTQTTKNAKQIFKVAF